jgi:hypothetical protein
MTVPAAQVPEAPVDAVMPAAAQLIATVAIGALCVGALVLACVRARVDGPMPAALLVGGALAVVDEPVLNLLGGLWHARHGAWSMFELFDRPMPVWAAGGYLLFFGAVPLVILAVLRRDGTQRVFFRTIGVIMAADLAIELPVVGSGMYVYYGYQPWKLFGILPAEWLLINGLAPAATAVLLHRFPGLVAGRRWPVALVVPAVTQYAAWPVGIPFFSAFNGGASHPVLWLAAAVTMALGLAGFVGLGRLLPRSIPAAVPVSVPAHS